MIKQTNSKTKLNKKKALLFTIIGIILGMLILIPFLFIKCSDSFYYTKSSHSSLQPQGFEQIHLTTYKEKKEIKENINYILNDEAYDYCDLNSNVIDLKSGINVVSVQTITVYTYLKSKEIYHFNLDIYPASNSIGSTAGVPEIITPTLVTAHTDWVVPYNTPIYYNNTGAVSALGYSYHCPYINLEKIREYFISTYSFHECHFTFAGNFDYGILITQEYFNRSSLITIDGESTFNTTSTDSNYWNCNIIIGNLISGITNNFKGGLFLGNKLVFNCGYETSGASQAMGLLAATFDGVFENNATFNIYSTTQGFCYIIGQCLSNAKITMNGTMNISYISQGGSFFRCQGNVNNGAVLNFNGVYNAYSAGGIAFRLLNFSSNNNATLEGSVNVHAYFNIELSDAINQGIFFDAVGTNGDIEIDSVGFANSVNPTSRGGSVFTTICYGTQEFKGAITCNGDYCHTSDGWNYGNDGGNAVLAILNPSSPSTNISGTPNFVSNYAQSTGAIFEWPTTSYQCNFTSNSSTISDISASQNNNFKLHYFNDNSGKTFAKNAIQKYLTYINDNGIANNVLVGKEYLENLLTQI